MQARMPAIETIFWIGNGIVSLIGLVLGIIQLLSGYTSTGLLMFCVPLLSFFNVCVWSVKNGSWPLSGLRDKLLDKLFP
jgi:hypothetical protein